MIVSPTEPPALKKLGIVSMLPERYGCDLLFASRGRWFGVQRKEFGDLLASMRDGRIAQQVAMMNGLEQAMFVIEGMDKVRWGVDGASLDGYTNITLGQIRALLWSVRDRGMWVDRTSSLTDTVQLVGDFERWCKKPGHKALSTRPGPVGNWGTATSKEWQSHLLQGFPGVGVELADRILDEVGMPLQWRVTRGELARVHGMGAKKIDKLARAVPGMEE